MKLPSLGTNTAASPSTEVETIVEGPLAGGAPSNSATLTISDPTNSGTNLPTSVDNSLEPWFPPIGDQGRLGACVAFATTYYQLSAAMARARGWTLRNSDGSADYTHIYSPKFAYNIGNGGADEGLATDRSFFSILMANGAPSWSAFPYDGNDFTSWPIQASVWQGALTQREDSFQYVSIPDSTPAGLLLAKQLLVNGHILAFGNAIDSFQYGNITSATQSGLTGQPAVYASAGFYNHEMVIVGYDDTMTIVDPNGVTYQGAFKIANQWGTTWQVNGFAWVAYDAVNGWSRVSGSLVGQGRNPIFAGNLAIDIALKDNGSYVPQVVAQFTVSESVKYDSCLTLTPGNPSQTVISLPPAPDPRYSTIQTLGNGLCQTRSAVQSSPFNGMAAMDLTDYLQSGNANYLLNGTVNPNGVLGGKGTISISDFRLVDSSGNPLAVWSGKAGTPFALVTYAYSGPLRLTLNQPVGGTIQSSVLSSYVNPHSSVTFTITPAPGYSLYDFFVLPGNYWADPSNIEYLCSHDKIDCVPFTHNAATGTYSYVLSDVTASQQIAAELSENPAVTFADSFGNPVTTYSVNNLGYVTLNANVAFNGLPIYPASTPQGTWTQISSKNGGVATLSPSWFIPGSNPPNAQAVAQFSKPDIYDIRFTYSNGLGSSAYADLTVDVTATFPMISLRPFMQFPALGQSAQFSVTATGGAPLTYQWQKNGVAIANSNSSTYTTPPVAATDDGSLYSVTVSNATGSITSPAVPITISGTPPTISGEPADQTVNAGGQATFSVIASGTDLHYQWFEESFTDASLDSYIPIPGATSPSYKTPVALPAGLGNRFYAQVSNPFGSTFTSSATLFVNGMAPPQIASNPASITALPGQSVTLHATVSGAGVISCQWYKYPNQDLSLAVAIPGATLATYTTPPTTLEDTGYNFFLVATNPYGVAEGGWTSLTVNPPADAQPAHGFIGSINAIYGTNCGNGANVPMGSSAFFKACFEAASCNYAFNYLTDVGYDPDVGCAKDLTVRYQCTDLSWHVEYIPGEAGLGSMVSLSCE